MRELQFWNNLLPPNVLRARYRELFKSSRRVNRSLTKIQKVLLNQWIRNGIRGQKLSINLDALSALNSNSLNLNSNLEISKTEISLDVINYEQQRFQNTIDFLKEASIRNSLANRLIKSLLLSRYSLTYSTKPLYKTHTKDLAKSEYGTTLGMLANDLHIYL